MSLVYGDTSGVLANRDSFLGGLGINYRDLVCAKQVHADRVAYVSESQKGSGALDANMALDDIDAMITDKSQLPLAIFSADCLSVFLFDPLVPAVGIVHAGWRSSKRSITAKTIKLMQAKFNTQPENLLAGFGPSIGACCYEIKKEVHEYFPQYLTLKDGRYYLDLAAVNRDQLKEAGVKDSNISDPGICTVCQNKDYSSYRQEKDSAGRIMSVIMLK